jgi:acetyl esterase/lipase
VHKLTYLRTIMTIALGSLPLAAAAAPYDIPRLPDIVINGQADDWGDAGFRVEVLYDVKSPRRSCANLDARLRLGWNDRGLLGLVDVTDDTIVEADEDANLWQLDSVEVFVATGVGELDLYQAVFAPGLAPAREAARSSLSDFRPSPALKGKPLSAQVARRRTEGGYALEFLLPWSNLARTPEPGATVALQVHVNDADRKEDAIWGRRTLFLHPAGGGCQWDTTKMVALRLAEQAGSPVTAVARAEHEDFRRVRLDIAALASMAGQRLTVSAGGVVLAETTPVATGRLATATVALPMPPFGATYDPIIVAADGQTLATTGLPGLQSQRAAALAKAALRCDRFVFSGRKLPKLEFEQPAAVEDLIGPYTLDATYYNAAFDPITEAAQPGRYGAVIEIRAAAGVVATRTVTLFRQAGEIEWPAEAFAFEPPAGLGLDAAVAAEHRALLQDFAQMRVQEGLARDPRGAVLLAGLRETPPGTRFTRTSPGTLLYKRTGVEALDRAWWHELKRRTGRLTLLPYHLYVPEAAAREPARRWPTFLWLHGSSTTWENAAKTELITHARNTPDFPYLVIAPNCPANERWDPQTLKDLLADLQAKLPIDPDRVYLSGTSMGGYGTWATATTFPELFAAAIPLCGGGDPEDVARLKDLPVWVFHGTSDTVVPIARSEEMVEALRAVGGRVRFSRLDCGHDPGRLVFSDPAVYAWLGAQVRGKPGEPANADSLRSPAPEGAAP